MATQPAKVYKISKKPRSDYTIKSSSPNSQEYAVRIDSDESDQSSFLFLHEGTSTKDVKTIVASVRRVPDEGAFGIACSGPQGVDDSKCSTLMRRTLAMTSEMQVSLPDAKPCKLSWRPNFGPGMSCNLVDMEDPHTILARYDEDPIFGRGGKLALNVDWGVNFERTVLTSAVSMIEKTSVWAKARFEPGARFDAPMSRGMGIVVGFSGGYEGAGGDI